MTNYLNPTLCRECGGKCCKQMPGAAYPQDFGNDLYIYTALVAAFQTGKWVIDWWEGDPRNGIDRGDEDYLEKAYYIRPRSLSDKNRLYNASWGGQCCFLTPTGCELAPDYRPQTCRELEPMPDEKCVVHNGSKRGAALAWIPYHDIIEWAAREATQ